MRALVRGPSRVTSNSQIQYRMNSAIQSPLTSTLRFPAVLIAAGSFCLSSIFASPPPVTVTQPVQVEVVKSIPVQGTVETLNDSLNTSFYRTLEFSSGQGTVQFSVPAGKRLIIESVAYNAIALQGVPVILTLFVQSPIGTANISLPAQSVVNYGGNLTWQMGVAPLHLRVDGGANTVIEVYSQSPASPVGAISFSATVAGYLVDI